MSAETTLLPLAEAPTVKCVVVYNPLDVSVRQTAKLVWRPDATLADYLLGLPDHIEWVVSLDGVVAPAETWRDVRPSIGSILVLVPVIRGGRTGKTVLRIAATIAVAVAAYYVGGLVGEVGTWQFAAASAATMTVGTLIINALLPLPLSSQQQQDNGQSYGAEGVKNTSAEDVPVPLVFGEYRVAGNLASYYAVNDGDDQILYAQIVLSEGEIEWAGDVQINDQPLSAFQQVSVEHRLGTADQEVIPWFEGTSEPFFRGASLTTDWTEHVTSKEVDRLRLHYVAPQGLIAVNSKGTRLTVSVPINIEYAPCLPDGTVTGGWIGINRSQPRDARGSLLQEVIEEVGDSYGTALTISGQQQRPLRRSIDIPLPGEGYYKIRTRRGTENSTDENTADDIQLSEVVEIIDERVRYIHTALTGLQIKLNDQLPGFPKITTKVKGIKCAHYGARGNFLGRAWTQNPAWQVLESLTNARWGGGLPTASIDISRFVEWAARCADQGLQFNGVIDASGNLWDALQPILRAGHAQLIRGGTRWTLAFEMADDPVMPFNAANIIQGSLQLDWLPMDERANEFEGTYYDKDNNFERATLRIVDDAAIARGEQPRAVTIDMRGVTSRDQAWRDLNLQMNLNRYVRLTATWDSPIEAIACTIGDVVLLQHDLPQWGHGGKLEMGCTRNRLKLDRPVPVRAGVPHKVLVHHAAVSRGIRAVNTLVGTSIFVSSIPTGRVRRLRWGTSDAQIMAIYGNEVVLDRADGLNVGQAVEFWDTDVIDEVNVVVPSQDGQVEELELAQMLQAVPDVYANWMFGPVGKTAKPFRIHSIDYTTNDNNRRISALEYNAAIFADPLNPTPTPNYSTLDRIGQIQVERVQEEALSAAGERVRLKIFWNRPSTGLYNGADVWLGRYQEPLEMVAQLRQGALSYELDLAAGETVRIKLIAVDLDGLKSNFSDAPIYTYTSSSVLNYQPSPVENVQFNPVVISTTTTPSLAIELTFDHEDFVDGQSYYEAWYRLVTELQERWVYIGRSETPSVTHWNAQPGAYQYRIVAYNRFGRASLPALAGFDLDDGNWIQLSRVIGLELYGAGGSNEFTGRDISLSWRGAFPSTSFAPGSEPFAGAGSVDPMFRRYVVRVFDPVSGIMLRSVEQTETRLTYTYEMNLTDARRLRRGPYRELRFQVTIQDRLGRESRPATIIARNPAPLLPSVTLRPAVNEIYPEWTRPTDPDFEALHFWFVEGSAELTVDRPADVVLATPYVPISGLKAGTVYTFRWQAVDVFGSEGAPISDPVQVATRFIVAEDLAERILDGSLLTEELQGRIDLIDADTNTAGSVNARIQAEVSARVAALTALQADFTGALTQESADREQAVNDLIAQRNADFDKIMRDLNSLGQGAADADADLLNRIDAIIGRLDDPTGGLAAAHSLILSESRTRSQTDNAIANDLSALSVRVDANKNGISDAMALIAKERNASVTRDEANAQEINTLRAQVNDPVTGIPGAMSRISEEARASASRDDANANAISTLSSQVNDKSTGLSRTRAQLFDIRDTLVNADAALSSSISALSGQVNDPKTGLPATRSAVLQQLETLAGTTSANSSAIATLTSQLNDPTTGLSKQVAAIDTRLKTTADQASTTASQVNTLTTTVGDNTSSIQTLTTTTNGLSGQYTVKVDVNGYVAGFGLASTAINGAPTSEFIVRADKFAVIAPGQTARQAPFSVGTVNGEQKVVISSAAIGDATINSAHIGSLTASKIASGEISTAVIKVTNGTVRIIDPRTNVVRVELGHMPGEDYGIRVRDYFGNTVMSAGGRVDASKVDGLGALAGVSQITTANASTYIGSAAIGDALIGSLSASKITSGNISAGQIRISENPFAADGIPGIYIRANDGGSGKTIFAFDGSVRRAEMYSRANGDAGMVIRNAAGQDIVNINGLGVNVADTAQIRMNAVSQPVFVTSGDAYCSPGVETVLATSSSIDTGGNGGMVVAYVTVDSGFETDVGLELRLYIDKGAGWSFSQSAQVGVLTSGGDTYFRIPVSIAASATNCSSLAAQLRAVPFRMPGNSNLPGATARNIGIALMGLKR